MEKCFFQKLAGNSSMLNLLWLRCGSIQLLFIQISHKVASTFMDLIAIIKHDLLTTSISETETIEKTLVAKATVGGMEMAAL